MAMSAKRVPRGSNPTDEEGKPSEKRTVPAQLRGKGFDAHPEHINRKGYIKPRSQREFEALLDQLWDEEIIVDVVGEDGQLQQVVMTRMQHMILGMMIDRNPAARIHLLDRRLGKVKQQIELKTPEDGGVINIVIHDDRKEE